MTSPTLAYAQPANTTTASTCFNTRLNPAQQRIVDTVRDGVEDHVQRICAAYFPEITVLGVTAGIVVSKGVLTVDVALSHSYPVIAPMSVHNITDTTSPALCVQTLRRMIDRQMFA